MNRLVEEKLKGHSSIEVKRLHLPFTYTKRCQCENMLTLDLEQDYLSYPNINTPKQIIMYCQECDSEYEIDLQL